MMYLTGLEERMLRGDCGEAVARAMKVIVKVGEALGAERLIEVTHAHISGISYFNIGDPGLEFIEDLAKLGARFSVFTTANPYAVLVDYLGRSLAPEVVEKQLRIVSALRAMGSKAFTCTPYYVRAPKPGEHLAWAESSAVLYANSVVGAMTNREPGVLSLLAGIAGRTYLGEAHRGLPEEVGYVIEVERPGDPSEAGVYGLIAGRVASDGVALVRGLEGTPEPYVKEFLAAYATYSPTHIVVLEGITPGFRRVSSARAERIQIGRPELEKFYGSLDSCENPLYLIGCPHLSLEELEQVISAVSNVTKGEFWVTVGDPAPQVGEPRRGVKVIKGGCAVTTKLSALGVDCVITDSAKALTYIPKLAGVRAYLMRRDEILRRVAKRG
jgi:predicted aconitase